MLYKNITKTQNLSTQKYIYTVSTVGRGRGDWATLPNCVYHWWKMQTEALHVKSEWPHIFPSLQWWLHETPEFHLDPLAASLLLVVNHLHSGSFYPAWGCRLDCSLEMLPVCAAGPKDFLKGWGYCLRSSLPSAALARGSICPRWPEETCGNVEICAEDTGSHGGWTRGCYVETCQDSGDCSGN